MKKTLVALASMAALGAFAQSSVTMYGIVEATVDAAYKNETRTTGVTVAAGVSTPGIAASAAVAAAPGTFAVAVNNGVGTGTSVATTKAGFRVQDGNSQGMGTSRIGWRGTEDLGGGLKANFQLEMGLRVDDGCASTVAQATGVTQCANSGDSGGNLFGRNAWVGASGGFGEVRLGRQVLGSFGVQGNSWAAGSSSGLYEVGNVSPAMGGVRFSNAIRYLSTNMGGFEFSAALAAPENTVESNNGFIVGTGAVTSNAKPKTGLDLHGQYANGPLYIGLGYNTRGDKSSGASSTVANATAPNQTFATENKINAWTLGASYDLGVAKPFFNYTTQKTTNYSMVQAIGAATSNTLNNNVEHKGWTLGVRAPIGAATLIAGYGKGNIDGNSNLSSNIAATQVNTVTSEKLTAFNLGVQYPLSKRTMLEANYGAFKRTTDIDARSVVGNNGFSTDAVRKESAFNVGLRHTF